MALTHEQYQNIMATAVAKATRRNSVIKPRYNSEAEEDGWEVANLETYFNEVHDSFYEKFDRDEPETEENKAEKCMVFAASHALETAYGVVACERIKNHLDDIFADKNNPLLTGISDKEKAETLQQMKDMVDNQVLESERSIYERRLVRTVKSLLENNYNGNTDRFLSESFAYLNWMNDSILKKDLTADEVGENEFHGTCVVGTFDEKAIGNLKEAVLNYMDGIEDTLDDALIHPTLSKDFDVTYDKHSGENSINPQVFVEHYNHGKLTEEEKNWALRRTKDLMNETQALFETSRLVDDPTVSIGQFCVEIADGLKPLVSDEDAKDATKEADMSAKVMATILKGEDVIVDSKGKSKDGSDVPMHINPNLCDKTVSTFWESIWEKLSEIISKVFGNTTERKSLSEMIDNLDKSNEEHKLRRKPMSFDDLLKAGNAYNKVKTTTEKGTPTKQNTKQNGGMSF